MITARVPSNTAAAFFDPNAQTVFAVTEDFVLNQFSKEFPRVSRAFDEAFAVELREISRMMALVTARVMASIHLKSIQPPQLGHVCGSLLSNAMQGIVAALALMRCGFRLQPPMVIRPCLEQTAASVALYVHPEQLDAFLAGQVATSKILKQAKQLLPPLGKLLGVLSEEYLHLGSLHSKPHSFETLHPNDPAATTGFVVVRSTMVLIEIAADLIYYDLSEKHDYFERIATGQYRFNPGPETKEGLTKFLTRLEEARAPDQ